MEGGRWGGKKERERETEMRRGGRMLKGRRDEKGKETGKEEVLPWIKYITVHQLLPPPPTNATFLFTECTSTKSAFTYKCVKHHLPAL